MEKLEQRLLETVKTETQQNEIIEIKSIIPKYEGVLCHHFLQYAVVDAELERVTLLPSFIRNMEDFMRFLKTAEGIHNEAIEIYKGTL